MVVALPWQVYELTNSPATMGLVGALQMIPIFAFTLFGGVASDRVDRRKVIIAADVVRAVAAGAIGILALRGDLELWHVAAMALVYGLGQAFAGPAFGSIVPQLVPDELLVQANSALFTVNPLAFLFIGPALGGFTIAAAGTGVAFLLDAASFVIGALAIALIAARPAARILDEGERRTIVQDIRESFRYAGDAPGSGARLAGSCSCSRSRGGRTSSSSRSSSRTSSTVMRASSGSCSRRAARARCSLRS